MKLHRYTANRAGRGGAIQQVITPSDLNAPSYVTYAPREHPANIVADAIMNGDALPVLPTQFVQTDYECDIDNTPLAGGFYIDTTCVVAGDLGLVTNSANWQSAIDASLTRAQNTKIMLPNPFPAAGILFKPNTAGAYWTYHEAVTKPCAKGVRATEAMMDAVNPPTLQYAGSSGSYTCLFLNSTHRQRLIGIRWITIDGYGYGANMLGISPYPGDGTGDHADWNTQRLDRIIIERVHVRGGDRGNGSTTYQQTGNGIRRAGSYIAIIDSTIDGIVVNNETHAVLDTSGGPFKLDNCHLSAGSSCHFSGGTGPEYGIDRGPSQSVIRHCEMTRPHAWLQNDPAWDHSPTRFCKNNIETKILKFALFEGNVVHRCVPEGQNGHLVVIKAANDGGYDCDISGVSQVGTNDVTMRWNRFADAPVLLTVQGSTSGGPTMYGTHASYPVTRFAFYHNLADRIGPYSGYSQGPPFEFSFVHDGTLIAFNTVVPVDDVNIHIVSFQYPGLSDYGNNLTRTSKFRFLNNIVPFQYVSLDASNTTYTSGSGEYALITDTDSSYRWAGNCAINPATSNWNPTNGNVDTPDGTPGQVATVAAVKFKNVSSRNYRLQRVIDGDAFNSPFLGLANDMTNPGCDIDTVEDAIRVLIASVSTPVGTIDP